MWGQLLFKMFKNKTQVIYEYCAVGDHCPGIHATDAH